MQLIRHCFAAAMAVAIAASGTLNGQDVRSRGDDAFGKWNVVAANTIEYRKGVTLKRLVLEKSRRMVAHVARIDLTMPGISFTGTERDPLWGRPMPDYTNETWLVNTRRETTADFMMRRRGEGRNVEIAVNTSGWRPWGGAGCRSTYAALYRYAASEGMEVSHGKDPERGVFFIARKDGQVLIRPHVPVSMTNDVLVAVYGNRRILRRGIRTADADPAKAIDVHPRTAFGLSQDRKTFVILAVDGRQPGYSDGATCADLADVLLHEGCSDAINMDGGGSTSLVIYDRERNRPIMLNHHANGYVRKTALNLGLIFHAEGIRPADRHAMGKMHNDRQMLGLPASGAGAHDRSGRVAQGERRGNLRDASARAVPQGRLGDHVQPQDERGVRNPPLEGGRGSTARASST